MCSVCQQTSAKMSRRKTRPAGSTRLRRCPSAAEATAATAVTAPKTAAIIRCPETALAVSRWRRRPWRPGHCLQASVRWECPGRHRRLWRPASTRQRPASSRTGHRFAPGRTPCLSGRWRPSAWARRTAGSWPSPRCPRRPRNCSTWPTPERNYQTLLLTYYRPG